MSLPYRDCLSLVEANCSFTRMSAHRYIKLYSAIQNAPETKPVVTPVLQVNENTESVISDETQTNNFIEKLPA